MSKHHPSRGPESRPSNINRPSMRDMADLLEACLSQDISPAQLAYLVRHDPETVRWALSRHESITSSSGVYKATEGVRQNFQDVDVPHSVQPELVDPALPQLQEIIQNIQTVGVPLEPGTEQPIIETPLASADFKRLADLDYIRSSSDFSSVSSLNVNGKFASVHTADGKKLSMTLDEHHVLSSMSSLESF